jgi:iron(III) transport system substrate-binding protein
VAAIYTIAGDEKADEFFRKLKSNGVKIVDGNSVVRDMVVRGEVKVGLTDTDDANVAIEDKQPLGMVFPDREGIGVPVMPNMVSLIAGAPHPEEGKRLIDFLLSPESERLLAVSDAVQIPLQPGVEHPPNLPALDSIKPMTLDYQRVADRLEEVIQRLQPILGL